MSTENSLPPAFAGGLHEGALSEPHSLTVRSAEHRLWTLDGAALRAKSSAPRSIEHKINNSIKHAHRMHAHTTQDHSDPANE